MVLQAEGLVKAYNGTRALDGFTLDVGAGEIVGLVGPNGAGKSTFVEVVTGLTRPDAGRLTIDGIDALAQPRRARQRVGVSPQETALYPAATVREHLRLFGGLAGLRRAALRAAIDEVAQAMALSAELDKPAGLLSGGQRRRTQAATALIARPAVLLLDEPTVGADPVTRGALLDVVRRYAHEGSGVVYTTHYLPELTDLGATVAFARDGRVVARGDLDAAALFEQEVGA
jgi:ABC-2 type transport system ATP-binding protein